MATHDGSATLSGIDVTFLPLFSPCSMGDALNFLSFSFAVMGGSCRARSIVDPANCDPGRMWYEYSEIVSTTDNCFCEWKFLLGRVHALLPDVSRPRRSSTSGSMSRTVLTSGFISSATMLDRSLMLMTDPCRSNIDNFTDEIAAE
jgi:hypothetical protein